MKTWNLDLKHQHGYSNLFWWWGGEGDDFYIRFDNWDHLSNMVLPNSFISTKENYKRWFTFLFRPVKSVLCIKDTLWKNVPWIWLNMLLFHLRFSSFSFSFSIVFRVNEYLYPRSRDILIIVKCNRFIFEKMENAKFDSRKRNFD